MYEIKEKAIRSGRAVFSIQQLSNLASIPKKISKVYASRLVKKGLAKKLIRGRLSFSDDEFVISTQLIEPSYVSGISALNLHDLMQQIPKNIQCVSTKNTRKFDELGIYYHKIPPKLFFGFEKVKKENSYFFLADKEKAIIDSIYLNIISKKTAKELLEQADKEKFKSYVEKFKGRGRKKLEEILND